MKHVSPTRKLADALFRGRDAEHSFKVYPLSANITDQPAVFIISRRIVDRSGRGHHAVICIGQTPSTHSELKKHKRAKCVKERSANVVCLLKEKDQSGRLGIIEDLVAGRSFICVNNVYKSNIEPEQKKRSSKVVKTEKVDAKNSAGKSASKPVRAGSKRTAITKTGTRVQSGLDRDRRQHRLSKSKRTVAGKPKARAASKPRAGKKAAA